ncbi:hypothetical protein L2Z53_02480 [Macrococcoides canis]|uniref:hypothetical protein n=1 Tax=Macrococcoides canis TaxID=1855823 RepID=UPI001F16F0DB|nr:hypothetical protein [Macrococcus canis]UJS28234.1 hypothetical protein L2Z53_02480 [Macrococcus canis]
MNHDIEIEYQIHKALEFDMLEGLATIDMVDYSIDEYGTRVRVGEVQFNVINHLILTDIELYEVFDSNADLCDIYSSINKYFDYDTTSIEGFNCGSIFILNKLLIYEKFRGIGIGRNVIKELQQFSRINGYGTVILNAFPFEESEKMNIGEKVNNLEKFYKENGFKTIEKSFTKRICVMIKDLSQIH